MNPDTKSMQTGIVEEADLIYYGGDIVTMNNAQPSAEALAVKDIVVEETIKEGVSIYTKTE